MRRSARPTSLLALLLGHLLGAGRLDGQAADPFSRLDISAAVAVNTNRERLHRFWSPETGGALRVGTPFYLGSVAATAQISSFRARDREQPDFRARTFVAEWNVPPVRTRALRASAGVQAGSMDMIFTHPDTTFENADENEFLVGAQAALAVRSNRGWGLILTAARRKIFTRVPIHLTYLALGVEYSTTTPAWVRRLAE